MSAKNRITDFPYTTISKVATKQGNSQAKSGGQGGKGSYSTPFAFLTDTFRVAIEVELIVGDF